MLSSQAGCCRFDPGLPLHPLNTYGPSKKARCTSGVPKQKSLAAEGWTSLERVIKESIPLTVPRQLLKEELDAEKAEAAALAHAKLATVLLSQGKSGEAETEIALANATSRTTQNLLLSDPNAKFSVWKCDSLARELLGLREAAPLKGQIGYRIRNLRRPCRIAKTPHWSASCPPRHSRNRRW
jgi:hypothetical protein